MKRDCQICTDQYYLQPAKSLLRKMMMVIISTLLIEQHFLEALNPPMGKQLNDVKSEVRGTFPRNNKPRQKEKVYPGASSATSSLGLHLAFTMGIEMIWLTLDDLVDVNDRPSDRPSLAVLRLPARHLIKALPFLWSSLSMILVWIWSFHFYRQKGNG